MWHDVLQPCAKAWLTTLWVTDDSLMLSVGCMFNAEPECAHAAHRSCYEVACEAMTVRDGYGMSVSNWAHCLLACSSVKIITGLIDLQPVST